MNMTVRGNRWNVVFVLCVVSLTMFWLHWLGRYTSSLLDGKKTCKPKKLGSNFKVSTEVTSWKKLEMAIKNVAPGGVYIPKGCIPNWKIAIIVPYRDRENHLKVFVKNMHLFLQQQQICYGIFVIEMPSGPPFNRGLLMNIGFQETRRLHNYTCFIFHDVDLIPEHTGNIYRCGDYPIHMASAIDTRNYKIYYKHSFGGVNAFTKEQFIRVNGFSTAYFGWGLEDDDLFQRCLHANLTMKRLSVSIGRYKNLAHPRAAPAERNQVLYKTRQDRYFTDGISNFTYRRMRLELRPLYTWILVGGISESA